MRFSPKGGTKDFREMRMDGKTWADEVHGDTALLWLAACTIMSPSWKCYPAHSLTCIKQDV